MYDMASRSVSTFDNFRSLGSVGMQVLKVENAMLTLVFRLRSLALAVCLMTMVEMGSKERIQESSEWTCQKCVFI